MDFSSTVFFVNIRLDAGKQLKPQNCKYSAAHPKGTSGGALHRKCPWGALPNIYVFSSGFVLDSLAC